MNTQISSNDHPAYYSLTDAAWILGVTRSQIHRAIRTGVLPVIRRRSRLVVPADALTRLLGTTRRHSPHQRGCPVNYDDVVSDLDHLAAVPDDVLAEVVTRDGLCFWAFDRSEIPELSGLDTPDRELAAGMCAGCPVVNECLELDLRTAGADTVGVWGARSDTDRREIHAAWMAHRNGAQKRGGRR